MDRKLLPPTGRTEAARVRADPAGLGLIVTRGEALRAGLTRDEIRQRVRGCRWQRLDTGVYLRVEARARDLDDFAEQRVAHVQRAVAAVLRHPGAVIGYASAALVHGLPLISAVPQYAQIIAAPGGWTGLRNGARYREASLSEGTSGGSALP